MGIRCNYRLHNREVQELRFEAGRSVRALSSVSPMVSLLRRHDNAADEYHCRPYSFATTR